MENIQTAEKAFNQLLLHIIGKNFLENLSTEKFDSKSIIEKSIEEIKEEYSYSLSLQAQCVPDAGRMISQAKRKLEGLEALLTLAKLL